MRSERRRSSKKNRGLRGSVKSGQSLEREEQLVASTKVTFLVQMLHYSISCTFHIFCQGYRKELGGEEQKNGEIYLEIENLIDILDVTKHRTRDILFYASFTPESEEFFTD